VFIAIRYTKQIPDKFIEDEDIFKGSGKREWIPACAGTRLGSRWSLHLHLISQVQAPSGAGMKFN